MIRHNMKELFTVAKSAEGNLYLIWRNGDSIAPLDKKIVKLITETIKQKEVK